MRNLKRHLKQIEQADSADKKYKRKKSVADY